MHNPTENPLIQAESKGSVQFGPLITHRSVKLNRMGLCRYPLIRLLIDCIMLRSSNLDHID